MKQIPKIVLLLETSRSFGRQILSGVVKYSRFQGPWAFYKEPRDLESALPHLKNWKPDGIIMRNTKSAMKLLDFKIPTILVLHDKEEGSGLPTVITNDESIGKTAAEHLVSRGFKNFGYCGFDSLPWSVRRCEFFSKYLNERGFSPAVFRQSNCSVNREWEKEQLYMAKWLKELPKPAGIMACNDDRGQHVLEACKIAKMNVPDEVSVIGVDNDSLICDLCDPPLSSIALNAESAGYSAAELLDKLMRRERTKKQNIIVTPTHVVCRQSTDILAVDDPEVVKAIRFIRQNAKSKILVSDVVEKTNLSRRSLEVRFKKIIHRSIKEEMRKLRTDLIEQMLIETNLTIAEITASYDFTDQEHISRYFKKEKSVGLREFRKLYRRC